MKIEPKQFGKYLLLDRIGVGGMAEIWRARQFGAAGFQKQLVIKKILQHLADNDEFVRMFIDEAKISVSLQHANVVQVFDLGAVQNEYFIAMEYIVGKDLLNLLIRCTQLRIRIPQKLAIFIVCEALKGLEAAHTATDSRGAPLNIIHRDVSPSNVIITFEGEVKLGDFGVAKASQREAKTRSGTMKGKLGYMSPEQVTGQEIDHRADLFSAAILLFEMLAMNRLFQGKTELETLMLVRDCDIDGAMTQLPTGVPLALREILGRALSQDREDRYQTATEFLQALLDHLFEEKMRVTTQDMGRFMKSVFATEIDEELERQEEIDRIVSELLPTLDIAPPSIRIGTPPPVPATFEGIATDPTAPPLPSWNEQSQFLVRDMDGSLYGPMRVDSLVEVVDREGRGTVDQLSADGAEWMPARELNGIVEATRKKRRSEPDFSGKFDRFELPRLFYRYAACRATGRMALVAGGTRKTVYWRKGRPEHVTSNLRRELLGTYLVDSGVITPKQLSATLEDLAAYHNRLDDALLQNNLLTAHDLFTAMSEQAEVKLLEIFGWPRGRYAFTKGELTEEQIVPLEESAYALVNRGVVKKFRVDEIRGFFSGQEHRPFIRLDHKLLRPEMLQLSTKQLRVWNAVAPKRSIGEQFAGLAGISGVSEADVYQTLFLMERLDFARFGS